MQLSDMHSEKSVNEMTRAYSTLLPATHHRHFGIFLSPYLFVKILTYLLNSIDKEEKNNFLMWLIHLSDDLNHSGYI